MPWKKGESGNPSGRPKVVADIRDACRAAGAAAIAALVEELRSDDGRTRIAAATALLDRGYGKPTQTVSGPDGGPIAVAHVNADEVRAKLARLADSASGAGEPDGR